MNHSLSQFADYRKQTAPQYLATWQNKLLLEFDLSGHWIDLGTTGTVHEIDQKKKTLYEKSLRILKLFREVGRGLIEVTGMWETWEGSLARALLTGHFFVVTLILDVKFEYLTTKRKRGVHVKQ